MPLRFFFDESVDENVARALRRHGVNVLTTSELGRKTLSDADQLDFSRAANRVIYTTDSDFLVIVARWLEEGVDFPGVAYHAQGALTKGHAVRALLLLNEVYDPPDMANRVEFL